MTIAMAMHRDRDKVPGTTRSRGVGRQPLKPQSPWVSRIITGILVLGLVVGVVLNFSSISRYINRPITTIEVSGAGQFATDAKVTRLLQPLVGAGFFDLDVKLAQVTLEQDPWIFSAALKRSWPDTLRVDVAEQVAIARWGTDGLINQYGQIFTPQRTASLTSLPVLSGPQDAHEQMMEHYQRFSQILFAAGGRLTGLSLSPRGSWELTLNDETRVMLGRVDVEEKLQRFVDFYNTQFMASNVTLENVDMRYENGVAVSTGLEVQNELAGMDSNTAPGRPDSLALSGELEL